MNGDESTPLTSNRPDSKCCLFQGCNGRLSFTIFVAVLGMFQFGYNTTVINAPAEVSRFFINLFELLVLAVIT